MNKFENVGEDDDTTILMRQIETFFDYLVAIKLKFKNTYSGLTLLNVISSVL
jgi:hypothetical protein